MLLPNTKQDPGSDYEWDSSCGLTGVLCSPKYPGAYIHLAVQLTGQ